VHLTSANLPGALSDWSGHGAFRGSPLAVDIDGDGKQELVVTGGDANVYAYKLVNNQLVIDHTYITQPGLFLQSTPAVANIPGVGPAIFIGSSKGLVFGWNARTGALLSGWPQNLNPGPPFNIGVIPDVLGGVAAGDLDGDGVPEIVVCCSNFETTAFHADGTVYWRLNNDETILTTPVIGDIDGDGRPDVVIGGDSSPGPNYWQGGKVQALSFDGHRKWVHRIDNQVVQSSPVLADIHGDGKLEVFVGTGLFYDAPGGSFVIGLDSNGNDLPGWPFPTEAAGVDGRVQASPSVADLQGNGELDVLVADRQGKLFAIRPNGQTLWTADLGSFPDFIFATPVVADINNDGKPDVVISNGEAVNLGFDGATGRPIWNERGGGPTSTSYAVGQLKGDGTYQLALMGDGPEGNAQGPSSLDVWDLGSSTLTPPWSQMRQDAFSNAITRPAPTLRALTVDLFHGLLGRDPSAGELDSFVAQMAHAPSLKPVVQGIVSSQEARTRLISGWYQDYLGRPAEPGGIANWISVLASGHDYAAVQANIAGSLEAYIHSGNTDQSWVGFLYQTFLGRPPVGNEDAFWLNALATHSLNQVQIAQIFVLTPEATNHELLGWYQTFAPGGLTFPPQDDAAALGHDLRGLKPEEQMLPNLIVSNGEYVTTQLEGCFVRAAYQDVLGRPAGRSEVAMWEGQFEQGLTLQQFSHIVAGSSENHALQVRGYFQKLLGRQPSPSELALFGGYLDRGGRYNDVLADLTKSDEYFNQPAVAGDPTKFITKVLADLLDRDPFPTDPSFWLSQPNLRQTMPNVVTHAPEFYQHTVDLIFFQLLRRWGQTPSDNSRVLLNPQVFPPQVFSDYLAGGGSRDDVLSDVMSSPEYQAVAHNKAFWTGARWLQTNHP
jgi:hypothetical protein